MKLATLTLSSEKRQAPRMPVDWSMQLRVTGENEPFIAKAVNISKSGVAVSLERMLPNDAVAKLIMSPGYDQPEVHAYAYVAWAGVQADHPAAGLRFMGIGEEDEERLAKMVESWMLNAPRRGNASRH
jgi:hypothetical protein